MTLSSTYPARKRRSAAQVALLRRAVSALDHGTRLEGAFRVFDGRKWPAIRALRGEGLLTVEDYDGRSHHDVITLKATEAARRALEEIEADQ